MTTLFRNARILRNHQLLGEDLWVEDGKFVSPKEQIDDVVDLDGRIIAPGYIDLQINGGFGFDFSGNLDTDAVTAVAEKVLQFGVTSFLPTIVTSEKEEYPKLIAALSSAAAGAEVLGVHLEGPFINPKQKGAHNPLFIKDFTLVQDPEEFYGDLSKVKMVTLAPEIACALSAIPSFNRRGIVVAAGHTQASFEEMELALKAGVTMTTHLFNAMTPFHHRTPGVVGFTLSNEETFYSIICDGIHTHPKAVAMAWMANPQGIVLISDAISALGLGDGDFQLGTMNVKVSDGKALIKGTETLAGSVLRMDQAVRNLKAFTGCSDSEALEAASLHPAKVIGVDDRKGHLRIRYDADFIVLDNDLNVLQTYKTGRRVF